MLPAASRPAVDQLSTTRAVRRDRSVGDLRADS